MLRGFAFTFAFDSAFVVAQHAAPHLGKVAPVCNVAFVTPCSSLCPLRPLR